MPEGVELRYAALLEDALMLLEKCAARHAMEVPLEKLAVALIATEEE